MPKTEALRSYAIDAPHPVMREVARLALEQSYTQESLAKRWTGGISGGNVQRHFQAKRPREGTVRRYAEILGVTPEYLLLLHSHKFEHLGGPESLRDRDGISERGWMQLLALDYQTDQYEDSTDVVLMERLLAMPEAERRRYLETFALEWYRGSYLRRDVHPGYAAREAFEAIASPDLKLLLQQRTRTRVPGELRFVRLWELFVNVLYPGDDVIEPGDFDLLLAFVRALHEKRGIDVAPMDAALNDDDLYQQWREGRLQRKA